MTGARGTLIEALKRRTGFKNGCIIWVIEGGDLLSQAIITVIVKGTPHMFFHTCKFPFQTSNITCLA